MKYKYKGKCGSCGLDNQWEFFNEHADFNGNDILVFICKNCNHRQRELKVMVKNEK